MTNKTIFKSGWIFALLLFTALACIGQDKHEKKVLIIGIDGVRPDALLKANTKNIDQLWQNGAYSFQAQTDEISSSGPSWTAMLTGVWHDKHKVVSNSYKDPDLEGYPHFFRRIKQERPDINTFSVVNWGPLHQILQEGDADHASSPTSDRKVTARVVQILKNQDVDVMFAESVDGLIFNGNKIISVRLPGPFQVE